MSKNQFYVCKTNSHRTFVGKSLFVSGSELQFLQD